MYIHTDCVYAGMRREEFRDLVLLCSQYSEALYIVNYLRSQQAFNLTFTSQPVHHYHYTTVIV